MNASHTTNRAFLLGNDLNGNLLLFIGPKYFLFPDQGLSDKFRARRSPQKFRSLGNAIFDHDMMGRHGSIVADDDRIDQRLVEDGLLLSDLLDRQAGLLCTALRRIPRDTIPDHVNGCNSFWLRLLRQRFARATLPSPRRFFLKICGKFRSIS